MDSGVVLFFLSFFYIQCSYFEILVLEVCFSAFSAYWLYIWFLAKKTGRDPSEVQTNKQLKDKRNRNIDSEARCLPRRFNSPEKAVIARVSVKMSFSVCNNVMMQNSHSPVVSLSVRHLLRDLIKSINGSRFVCLALSVRANVCCAFCALMEQTVHLTWRCKSAPIFRAQMQRRIKYDFQIIFHSR